METKTKKTTAKKGLGTPKTKKLSKKEQELRALAEKVRKTLKKHNVKPFDRREIYGVQ